MKCHEILENFPIRDDDEVTITLTGEEITFISNALHYYHYYCEHFSDYPYSLQLLVPFFDSFLYDLSD